MTAPRRRWHEAKFFAKTNKKATPRSVALHAIAWGVIGVAVWAWMNSRIAGGVPLWLLPTIAIGFAAAGAIVEWQMPHC